jgi:peptidoglycan-associated lipoprotein
MSQLKLIFLVIGLLSVAGCQKNTVPDPEPAETVYDNEPAADEGWETANDVGGEDVGWNGGDPSGGELGNIIYFEFDSAEVRPDDTELVSRHALQLAENPSARLRLEGHADERGSREYNIGLGERRAQAVRRLLLIQGATAEQISTVSFGEERPAVEGGTEDAYEQNRRVELSYTN